MIDVSSLHCTTEHLTLIIPSPANFYIHGIPGVAIQYRSAEQSLRAVKEFFCCKLENISEGRSLEIPEWMFDVATCHNTRASQTPTVSVEALLELKLLIARPTMDGHGIAAEARHAPIDSTGGVNAKRVAKPGPTASTVPTTSKKDVASESRNWVTM
jgi:hypothetical protein